MTQIFISTIMAVVYVLGMLVGAEVLSDNISIPLYLGCLIVVNILCDSDR